MTTTRINLSRQKGMMLIILFIVFGLQSSLVQAQSYRHTGKVTFRGFEGSFGARTFSISSNIDEINNLSVLQEGGQLGFIFGNETFRTKIGVAGFYFSANSVSRTVDLFESDVAIHFYPLSLSKTTQSRVQPYVSAGGVYDKVKFFGYYLQEDGGRVNYSNSKEPFLGSIHQFRASVGTGIEVNLIEKADDFVQLFAEAKYGFKVSSKTSYVDFDETSISNQLMINIGVRFGSIR